MVCNQTVWFKREFSCIGTLLFWRAKTVFSSISKISLLNNKMTGKGIVLPLIYVDIFSCHYIIIASCTVIDSIKNGVITHATLKEGGEVEIACLTNFTLVGSAKLTCIKGKWSDNLPSCKGLKGTNRV